MATNVSRVLFTIKQFSSEYRRPLSSFFSCYLFIRFFFKRYRDESVAPTVSLRAPRKCKVGVRNENTVYTIYYYYDR